MATWTEPVTNRTSGSARMTYKDMNRITGNLVWLYDYLTEQGVTVEGSAYSKTTWTQNDIVTVAQWTELLTCLGAVCSAIGYQPEKAPTNTMSYTNINNVETIELIVHDMAVILDDLARINHWIGDPLYSGDDFNAGGLYT